MVAEAKSTEAKVKTQSKAPPKNSGPMIDWAKIGAELEAELKNKGWNTFRQRRNPSYLQGLVMRLIVRPLVAEIHKKGGK